MAINFAFTAIQAGQKSTTVNAEPRLIASSTQGKFQITSPVSKAMNVAVGENVQFLNNLTEVEAAINSKHPDIVAWCEENGFDIDSAEGKNAVIAEFGMWAICKGVLEYDSKGNKKMASLRYTKEEKQAFIDANGEELIADENMRNILIERVGNPDATDEELIAAISVEDIDSPTYHSATGSKTSTSGAATGVGCQLNFTDTTIWNALKKDLDENKDKKNRIYKVDLDNAFTVQINNGMELVDVTAYPISFIEDTDPIARVKKD